MRPTRRQKSESSGDVHATSPSPKDRSTPSDELVRRIEDPGYTPSVRRLGELLDLLGHDDDGVAKSAERAIARIELQYAARVAQESVSRGRQATRPARARLARLAGKLAQGKRDPDGVARAWLLEAVADPDPKTRRVAARGLGNLPWAEDIEHALATAFDHATSEDDARVFAVALGKIGGESAKARLASGEHGRASLIVDRELARKTPGSIDVARSPSHPLRVWFRTRSGLEDVVKEELPPSLGKARFVAPGIVEAELRESLAAALQIRTAMDVAFPLTSQSASGDLAADIVRALTSDEATDLFRTFTSTDGGRIRFRLSFARGGHRRAVVWRVAELVRAESRDLLNDPTESTWEVVVDDAGGRVRLELIPRGAPDTRFDYRERLVPASSHPTIAAALARVAPRSDDDVVWDPFVGAGAELVERARLGPYARLLGTDLDASAVNAARANLARAGVSRADIEQADACSTSPEGVTLIITNPPMGRRVQRGTHTALLQRFVSHAARVLVPGGSLVWLVPEPKTIVPSAKEAGLSLARAFSVDMGGFSSELSVWTKNISKKRKINEETRPSSRRGTRQAGKVR